ncbi:MAG: NUDIX hydrolase [Anaerolineae bacterium]|nr:NUDIX hydrolase [Anaerolineae bacterium]
MDYDKWLTVESHTIELPNGDIIEDWAWLITPDFVIVVAVTEDDQFLVFRQTKYCVEDVTLAPVGGYLDPGEDALDAAKRELFEETGYESTEWISLGQYCVDGNRGVGTAHLFLAQGARHAADANADDLEEQELLLLSQSEVEQALMAGEFKLVPWTAAVALALRVLDSGQ